MAPKLIDNPGGLHNRITRRIYLRPFTLGECRDYLAGKGFDWDYYQFIQCYMILGGVPFYWSMLEPQFSVPQNVDRLFFRRDGGLRIEFDELYNALFSNAKRYISVVRSLASHREGLTRDEISSSVNLSGGNLTKVLKNLERCDFIASYSQFGSKSKNAIYRLTDFYTLFYFRYLNGERNYDEEFWSHHFQSPQVAAWQGLTFELVCLAHLPQIKKALGISGVETKVSAWRYVPFKSSRELPEKGAQIDLLIARADKMINLCEIKFSDGEFAITKEYERQLRDRLSIFRQVTRTKCGVHYTFITPYGVANGIHHSIVNGEVTAPVLFDD
ncbi:MAG: winged helix-turn-helix transcriptional regulator [Victivallales bacterium]|nr:winged helix-turn-helix transcriptional regulator [Victivallales bacterium]